MHPVGIDLGTTNSVVAAMVGSSPAKVLPGPTGEDPVVPSVVWFDGARVIVGSEAKEQQMVGTKEVASFFKRQMGDEHARFVANGREYTPVELSAEVLRHLKTNAEKSLKLAVKDVVVTVPAYFYDPQRKATEAAAKLAGLNVLQLINEPTAAAIAFGVNAGSGLNGHILVYDLGGGTFDVTLLRVTQADLSVLTSDGDAELGGKDWDQRIVTFLASSFRDEHGGDPLANVGAIGDLYVAAENAKKGLSSRQSVTLSIAHEGESGSYELTREAFESLTADLMGRTLGLVDSVLGRMNLTPEKIDRVLLVGGSTRMPMVRTALETHFGKPPSVAVHPDHAVALGAAICAAAHAQASPSRTFSLGVSKSTPKLSLPGGRSVSDVAPHSLGMVAVNADNTAYVNAIIVKKDELIPHTYRRPFSHRTRANDDNLLEVFMTQGEDDNPGNVKYLGRYVIPRIPHDPTGKTVVEVDYTYDRGGSLGVAASVGGSTLEVRVEALPADVPDRFLQPPPKPVQLHVTAYLTFDLSGSMSGEPLEAAKEAAEAFLSRVDLAHMSVGVIAHADRAVTVLTASQNASQIRRAIDKLRIDMVGIGNSQHPFDEAFRHIRRVSGPRFVIALADGVWGDQSEAEASSKRLQANGVEVIAVGFGGADEDFLRRLASCDEATMFTSIGGLVDTFSTIASVITQTGGETSRPATESSSPARGSTGFWGLLGSKRS